jgi:predicted phage baseplate assembly protein
MLHEMEQVPQLTYVKFLQLLNIELRPAQPARAQLTFTAKENATRVDSVRARTRAMAMPDGGGDPLIFETEQGLDLIPLQLAHVFLFDGTGQPRDVTSQNAESGSPFAPFGWTPQIGNAIYLGFAAGEQLPERPFPRELRFRVGTPVDGRPPDPVSCREAVAIPAPPARLQWEYKPAQGSARWEPLALYLDESVAFTREGYVSIAGPPASIQRSREFDMTDERYWLRCRIAGPNYPSGIVPEIDFIRPNTVPAINLATVRDELVELSQGVPDQTFLLLRRPVRPESLVLTVTVPGDAAETWIGKSDFLGSGRDDPHYVLNATRGEIRFGDGERGRIPVAGSEIVAVEYRYGGGEAGNVSAGAISTLLTNIVGVDGVTNDRPAVGGADEERPEDLARQAPRFLRSRNRAVTAEDFAALARQAGGVAKATALELFHPDYPGVEVPGAVTVVVVPSSPAIEVHRPEPSPDLCGASAATSTGSGC